MTRAELAATEVALPALPAGLGPAAQRFARNTLRKSSQTQRTYLSVYGRFALHLAAMTGLQDPPPSALTADAVASYLDGLEAHSPVIAACWAAKPLPASACSSVEQRA
jgi:hypothetical protein